MHSLFSSGDSILLYIILTLLLKFGLKFTCSKVLSKKFKFKESKALVHNFYMCLADDEVLRGGRYVRCARFCRGEWVG